MDQLDKSTHKKVFGALTYIINYIRTEYAILLHPKRALNELLKNKGSSLLKGGSFLVANILLAQFIGELVGYQAVEFPFKIPWLNNWLGSISFLVIRYVLGIVIFLALLKWFIRCDKFNVFSSKVFSIICYASAIFVPFVLVKDFCNSRLGEILVSIVTSVFSQVVLKNGIGYCVGIISYLLIPLLLVIWWLWLVYLGLKFLGIAKPRKVMRIVISTYCIFFIFQSIIVFLSAVVIYKPIFAAHKIIIFGNIEKSLSSTPPNFLKASLLADQVANAEGMFPYFRYAAKIRAVTYTVATPTFRINNEQIVTKALKDISDRNYIEVEHILSKYLETLSGNKSDPQRPLYSTLMEGLKKAKEFRELPNYVDKQEEVFVLFTWPPAPIALFP